MLPRNLFGDIPPTAWIASGKDWFSIRRRILVCHGQPLSALFKIVSAVPLDHAFRELFPFDHPGVIRSGVLRYTVPTLVAYRRSHCRAHSIDLLFPRAIPQLRQTQVCPDNNMAPPKDKERKRKFHRRSKNGCTRCKARHVRCDEQKPLWYV